jgi:PBP1b-binding outer membrane lipoprotein LpoB
MTRTAAVLALTLVFAACSSGGGGTEAAPGAAQTTAPRRNPNELNTTELADPAIMSLTLYDAIQRLRPNWLRQRGATSIANSGNQAPQVMVNDSPSSMDALHSMRPTDVTGVQFMSGADATTLYGTGYVNGLIKVRTGGGR